MGNWMQDFEEIKDKERENELNIRLEKLLSYLENKSVISTAEKMMVLKQIVETYRELQLGAYEYDANDYENKKRELRNLNQMREKEESDDSKESESWNDYKKSELEEEEER